jgi:hypothetical protein
MGPCVRRDDNSPLRAQFGPRRIFLEQMKRVVANSPGLPHLRYCASANIPPAKECHSGVALIGQFKSFTAISAMPP